MMAGGRVLLRATAAAASLKIGTRPVPSSLPPPPLLLVVVLWLL